MLHFKILRLLLLDMNFDRITIELSISHNGWVSTVGGLHLAEKVKWNSVRSIGIKLEFLWLVSDELLCSLNKSFTCGLLVDNEPTDNLWTDISSLNEAGAWSLSTLFDLELDLEAVVLNFLVSRDHWVTTFLRHDLREDDWLLEDLTVVDLVPLAINESSTGSVLLTVTCLPDTGFDDHPRNELVSVPFIVCGPFLDLDNEPG